MHAYSIKGSFFRSIALDPFLAVWFGADGGFKRPFTEYLTRLEGFVAYDMPKILFCDPSHLDGVGARPVPCYRC